MHDLQRHIEEIFRRDSGRLISVLTRIFGPQNLELAEDVVQESFVRAMETWSAEGIPDNPEAWLLTTARNRAIDAIRRERTRRTFADDLAVYLDSEWTLASTVDEAFESDWARDDQLRMIFMCCHETVAPENRVTLILKTLCGLGVPAIARALLTTESTINKRLYRTRKKLEGVEFGLPTPEALPEALSTVHTALYLLFNEGFLSTSDKPIRRELCRDAMFLTKLLVDEPRLSNSDTVALQALMCFNAARLESRIDGDGRLVPLDKQDRSTWDRGLINEGFRLLARTARMGQLAAGRYHFEAAIAARHCSAETFADTDWSSICNLYDRLVEGAPSPLAELNRAVAISYRDGPDPAVELVEALRERGALPHSHVVAAVLANLYRRAGAPESARRYLEQALSAVRTEHERDLIALQFERAGGVA
ncbi:MAG: sigma-70 family RNA polymerase sigma factor [Gemmatimonadetes bacterium]|nr:sigma-70 family RNA polymerase sigma factor [Gemmatimonadota bacterium]